MNDPFHLSERQSIEFDTFETLFAQQQNKTLTNRYLSCISRICIEKRIEELKHLELNQGFVYVGEKNWLNDYLQHQQFIRYDQWVAHVFREIGVMFSYVKYSEQAGFPQSVWASEIPAKRLMTHCVKINPDYTIAPDLEISIYGVEQAPSLSHLVKLFEFLFCFESMVALIANNTTPNVAIEITGAHFTHPSCIMAWAIDFMSEYGADWDQTLFNRRLPNA